VIPMPPGYHATTPHPSPPLPRPPPTSIPRLRNEWRCDGCFKPLGNGNAPEKHLCPWNVTLASVGVVLGAMAVGIVLSIARMVTP
jgi:hypothetical protein